VYFRPLLNPYESKQNAAVFVEYLTVAQHKHNSLPDNSISPLTRERRIKTSRIEPFKFKIPSKNMREKPTNTTIIHSVY
jgi:hypothetical protein